MPKNIKSSTFEKASKSSHFRPDNQRQISLDLSHTCRVRKRLNSLINSATFLKIVRLARCEYSKLDVCRISLHLQPLSKRSRGGVLLSGGGCAYIRRGVCLYSKGCARITILKFYINNLSKSLLHWRIMLRHSHVEEFLKVAQMKYDVIETKRTWKIVDKRDDYTLISLKWIFIYKFTSNDFLFKYKARIVIRDDLQKVNNAQNVYAATFASKIFRIMMTFVVDFHFKIKQLNVVNVFLNVFNDEKKYCHMSNEYK